MKHLITRCSTKRNKPRNVLPVRYGIASIPDNPVELGTCRICNGAGQNREPIYHNDYVMETCRACGGSGTSRTIRADWCSSQCDNCRKTQCSTCPVAKLAVEKINARFGVCS